MKKHKPLFLKLALVCSVLTSASIYGQTQLEQQRAERIAVDKQVSVTAVLQLHQTLGMDFSSLEKMSIQQIREAIRKLSQPDNALARSEFERALLTGTKDGVIGNAFRNALSAQQLTRDLGKTRYVAGIPTGQLGVIPQTPKGIDPTLWTSLGPSNVSGRTRSIVVDPRDPSNIWVGSVSGGVWRSIDSGKSFSAVDDFMANLSISCMAQNPTSPDMLVAGTGEGYRNADGLRGNGAFVTKDGSTWEALSGTQELGITFVSGLAFSQDGKTLLMGVGDRGLAGIYRRKADLSDDFVRVFKGDVSAIRTHPTNGQLAVAGSLMSGKSYWTSDAGQTWTESEHSDPWVSEGNWLTGRVEVTYATADPKIVYASVDVPHNAKGEIDEDSEKNIYHGLVFKSTDGGKTFRKCRSAQSNQTATGYLKNQGWFGNCIWAGDPKNSGLVVVGGVDLWRSTDSAETFQQISKWYVAESPHGDQHTIVSSPKYDGVSNREVFFGNDGGVALAKDVATVGNDSERTEGWTRLENGLVTTQFYNGQGNETLGILVGGLQDNGTWIAKLTKQSPAWEKIYGGDGGVCQIDPKNGVIYGEYVYGQVHKYVVASPSQSVSICGDFWDASKRSWEWKESPYVIEDAKTASGNFIAPFALDPNNSSRLLVGLTSLWCTDNVLAKLSDKGGPAWAAIKPEYRPDYWGYISALAICPGRSNEIWVAHNDGTIFKTINGKDKEPDWEKVTPEEGMPNRICTQIVVDPKNRSTVYATFGMFSEENVWRTKDGGSTWESIAAGLVEAPVRTIAIHPDNSELLYVGTEVGIYASEDGGATWAPTNQGPANCSVTNLFFVGKKLFATTYGRGMFAIDLSLP